MDWAAVVDRRNGSQAFGSASDRYHELHLIHLRRIVDMPKLQSPYTPGTPKKRFSKKIEEGEEDPV